VVVGSGKHRAGAHAQLRTAGPGHVAEGGAQLRCKHRAHVVEPAVHRKGRAHRQAQVQLVAAAVPLGQVDVHRRTHFDHPVDFGHAAAGGVAVAVDRQAEAAADVELQPLAFDQARAQAVAVGPQHVAAVHEVRDHQAAAAHLVGAAVIGRVERNRRQAGLPARQACGRALGGGAAGHGAGRQGGQEVRFDRQAELLQQVEKRVQ